MALKRKPNDDEQRDLATNAVMDERGDLGGDEDDGEQIPQDTLVCALTGEFKPDKPEERVLQSLIEQLHREYRVEIADMERDVRVACLDAAGKKKAVTVGIVVYEHGKAH